MNKLQKILDWNNKKPTTDVAWAEDVKKESLDVKFDKQLKEMRLSLIKKLPHVEKDLDKFDRFPDAIRYELEEQLKDEFSGQELIDAIEEELASQHDYYRWKIAKINQSIERIKKEEDLRKRKKVSRTPIGTTYYIDSDNGNNSADGLTPTGDATNGPWATLHQFTENPRSGGDVAILRRGMTARYDDGGDLDFTSAGTIDNPIIIEAAYADEWSDDVDLSGTATATLTFGSKTVTFSSDISGVLAAGDWIYVASEDAKEFAYEVDSVSTVTVTLFLPYKGDQAGSGKTMTNMQSPPIWNTAAGDFQWNFNGDDNWNIQGIHIRGTDSNGNVEIDSCSGHNFKDVILEGNGSNDTGIKLTDERGLFKVFKTRTFNHLIAFGHSGTLGSSIGEIKDFLLDCDNVANSKAVNPAHKGTWVVSEGTIQNCSTAFGQGFSNLNVQVRNVKFINVTAVTDVENAEGGTVEIEDYDNVVSDSRQLISLGGGSDIPILQSETSTVRSGGSNISIKVIPSTNLSTNWEFSRLKLFDIPIYATTDSKTYTVYFRPTSTGDWTTDPTASELWIELEAWGHATNNFRKITKSTGVIDMNGSTDWQSLTVTVAPAQAGVAYLRCWYAKTKEDTDTFFVDPIPEVT